MVMDIPIRKLITWSTLVIVLLLVGGEGIIWQSSRSLDKAETEKERLVEAMLAFKNVRYHVVQIQQFLTDASAVGEADFSEALIERDNALAELEKLSNLMPEAKLALNIAKTDVNTLYDVGEHMANVYITQGREAGNRIMKADDGGFDVMSETLANHLDEFASRLDQQVALAADEQKFTRDSMTSWGLGLGSFAIVLILSANIFLGRNILGQLGTEPARAAEISREVAKGNLLLKLDVANKNKRVFRQIYG